MNIQAATATKNTSPTKKSKFKESSDTLLNCIIKSLSENKAEDITTIDLRGRTSIGDFMVVASGRSTRQVSSISQKLVDNLKTDLGRLSKVEGKDAGDWVLIDTVILLCTCSGQRSENSTKLKKCGHPWTTNKDYTNDGGYHMCDRSP